VAFGVQYDVYRVGEALPVLDLVLAAVYRPELLAPAAHVMNPVHRVSSTFSASRPVRMFAVSSTHRKLTRGRRSG
jgi:hypothetical protein